MSHIIVYLALLQIAHSAFRHSLIASPAFYIPRFTAPKTLLTETRATRNLDDDDVEENIDPLLPKSFIGICVSLKRSTTSTLIC